MPTRVVQQGECVSSLAGKDGLRWETVWNHPNNLALRRKRQDPNVLYPGDEIFIPDLEIKELPRSTNQRHKFALKGTSTKLKLLLLDDFKPRARVPYTLEVDGALKQGVTDVNGFLEEHIPAGAPRGRLSVGTGATKDVYDLQFGTLDPIDTDDGVRGRLLDLGFWIEDLKEAIKAFQQKEGLAATGEADAGTRDRLKEKFGQ